MIGVYGKLEEATETTQSPENLRAVCAAGQLLNALNRFLTGIDIDTSVLVTEAVC